MNRERFRHPLFSVPGLHEDDIAPGMRAYRWLRADEGRSRDVTMLKHPKPYTVRRPVTVLEISRSMRTVTLIERRENLTLPVDAHEVKLPNGDIYDGKRVYIRTEEKVDWLHTLIVRDEENGIDLEFMRDPPYRNAGGDLLPAVPFFFDGPRMWKLKLGRFADDRFGTRYPEDEHVIEKEELANA